MSFRNVSILVIWLFYCQLSFAKDIIRIGAFFNQDQDEITFWEALKLNLHEDVELVIETEGAVQRLSDRDIIEAKTKACNFFNSIKDDRLVAVLAPKSQFVSPILESISSYLAFPYIITAWRPKTEYPPNVFNVYPDPELLSAGYSKIIQSLDWTSGFIILYDDEDGLLRLQEVLKLQGHMEGTVRNDISIKKLNAGDNRQVLKAIRLSSTNKIVLDCHVDRIMDILDQAENVGLLSDFSTGILLTSLDAHTLDFSKIKMQANITAVRLLDPYSPTFQRIAMEYFPDILPEKIKVDTALVFDALTLIFETINQLKEENVQFAARELNCDSHEPYEDDIGLINILERALISNTLTGLVSFQNRKRDRFTLQIIDIDTPRNAIANWNSEYPDQIQLTLSISEREAELQRRMISRNFIVTSRIDPPYLMKDEKFPGMYKGYSMDLIKEVAREAKITFQFVITKDNSYTNLVTDLQERRADLGICDFTITPQRQEKIDFSMPFMNLGIGILHKEATQEKVDNMYAFMRPISWRVWYCMWTLSIVSSITMFFVARLSPQEWEDPKPWDPQSNERENNWNIKNFLWLSVGSITAQGCDILPKGVPTRVISASWWFFSLIIMSSYTANLAAFLTMQKRDVTIDSVEELAAQSKVKYGLMSKGSTELFFSTSNNSLYQKMWNTMINEKPSVFEKDNLSGVERVLSTKNGLYAYFMESTGIEYRMERECSLRKIGGLLDSKSYGIGMPLNAEYRLAINNAILKLQESGKLMELKELWWKNQTDGPPCNRNQEEQSDALALSNVGGIFIVLCVGIGLAYVIAIIEFLWNVKKLSKEEHSSYFETLKCELKFACNIYTRKKRVKPLTSESASFSKSGSDGNPDKLSVARDLFTKSAVLLKYNTDSGNERFGSQKGPTRTESSNGTRFRFCSSD